MTYIYCMNCSKIRSIISSLLFYLFFCTAFSYAQHYPFKTITLKDGLPQACVFKAIQDQQGYIWMGTEAGVCRYDGYEFVNYSYESGLLSNYVKDIEIDPQGRLWLGLFDCGAAVFDGSTFHSFDFAKIIGFGYIVDLQFSQTGDLWIADRDSGIIRIEMPTPLNPKATLFRHNGIATTAYKIMEAANGDILGFTGKGITRFKKNNNYEPTDLDIGPSLCGYEDPSGGLWIGGPGTLYFLQNDSVYDKSKLVDPDQTIYDMLKPFEDEGIYMATNQGVMIIENNQRTLLNAQNGLSYDLVRYLYKDGFGNVWASTYGNGATLMNKNMLVHYDDDGKGNDFCTFAMVEDELGNVWLGRYMDGYYICTDTSIQKADMGIPSGTNAFYSAKDKQNNLYFLTGNNRIYKVNKKKLVASYRMNIPSTAYCMLLLENQEIMLCTDAGVYIFNEKTENARHVEQIPSEYYSTVFEDDHGSIWIASDRGAILRYRNGAVADFTSVINPERSGINQAYYDRKHKLYWFCSDAGLIVWNGFKPFKITTNTGVKSDVFYSITLDSTGRIWAGHIKGLECIDLEQKQITHIGYNEGFLPMETNVNAAMTDSKGNVWFGTVTSASKVDVKHFGGDSTKGILRLQQINVNNQPRFTENYYHAEYPKLSLKHDENNISFQITSICFTNAEAVKYQWILEGEGGDKEWNEKLNYREISYNNLSPGSYVFKARAVNPNGYITNEISIPIRISKPFWNTIAFYLLEIAIFGVIVFLSFLFTSRDSENRFGQIMTLVAVLIVFEALLLFLSNYTDKYTNGIPVFQLVMNVLFAATLHPLESGIRKLMKRIGSKKKDRLG